MAVSGYAGKVGWTVGRASWLDDPASKVNRYWRQIEQGQTFSGVILIGLWGDRAGTNMRPNMLREGQAMSAAGDYGGQKFVPFGETDSAATALHRARFALWYFLTAGKMGRPTNEDLTRLHGASPSENRRIFFWLMSKAPVSRMPFVSARAKRSVEGRHYYTRALSSFDPMQVEIDMLRAEIGPLIRGAFTQGKARAVVAMDSPRSGPRKGPARREVADASSYLGGRAPMAGASGLGIVTVTAGAPVQDLIRVGNGQFPAGQWQAMLIDINRKVAIAFQEHVVALMEEGPHLRPSTGDLVRATADPRNRYPQ
jgi:hypothetical protein